MAKRLFRKKRFPIAQDYFIKAGFTFSEEMEDFKQEKK